jgi:hypothetical protein
VSERSSSEVSPVLVSTRAWFARGRSTTVESRPGSAAIGAGAHSERRGGTDVSLLAELNEALGEITGGTPVTG